MCTQLRWLSHSLKQGFHLQSIFTTPCASTSISSLLLWMVACVHVVDQVHNTHAVAILIVIPAHTTQHNALLSNEWISHIIVAYYVLYVTQRCHWPGNEFDKVWVQRDAGQRVIDAAPLGGDKVRGHDLFVAVVDDALELILSSALHSGVDVFQLGLYDVTHLWRMTLAYIHI